MSWKTSKGLPSYDSILDTMTNVVGVLIIVVIVTQVTISDAVTRTDGDGKTSQEITPEMAGEARARFDTITKLLEKLRARWEGMTLDPAEAQLELHDLLSSIETLQQEVDDPTALGTPPEELRQLLADLERELESRRTELLRASREFEDADGRVAAAEPSPNRLVLPDVDPGRSGERTQRNFYCRNGMIFELAEEELDKMFLEAEKKTLESKGSGKITLKTLLTRVVRRLEGTDHGNETFRLQARYENSYSWISGKRFVGNLHVEYRLRPGAHGDTIESLRGKRSGFTRALRALDPDKDWLNFRVFDDSFEVYLAAREIALAQGFPVGWVAYGPQEEAGSLRFRSSAGGGSGRLFGPDG